MLHPDPLGQRSVPTPKFRWDRCRPARHRPNPAGMP